MKKFLAALGILFLLVIAAIAYMGFTGSRLDKESADYANGIVPNIVKNWDMSVLATYGHPGFIQKMNQSPDRERIIAAYKSLGNMTSFNGCQGQSHVNISSSGKTTSAQYVCNANFEKAPATISLALFKDPTRGWLIVGFKVDSSYFLKSQ